MLRTRNTDHKDGGMRMLRSRKSSKEECPRSDPEIQIAGIRTLGTRYTDNRSAHAQNRYTDPAHRGPGSSPAGRAGR